MIDIHSHIMPGIDDGASNMAEAIGMLRIASESGVHTIVATPHCNVEGLYENYYNDDYFILFQKLKLEAAKEKIPIEILPGMEVYASEEVPALLKEGKIMTINGSRYILIEFGNQKDLALINFVIDELTNLGCVPIIAHPERYSYVQKSPLIAASWIKRGCLIQVNKGSILGSFGNHAKNTAIYMLRQGMVSIIASDAHGSLIRTTDMSAVYDYIWNNFSEEMAYTLMEQNPYKVIHNLDIIEQKLILN